MRDCPLRGRRQDEAVHALMWPAFEKRQGTKSRDVGHCNAASYGDLTAASGWARSDRSVRLERFGLRHEWECKDRGAERRLREADGDVATAESGGATRARTLPAWSQDDRHVSERWSAADDSIMRCRS